MRDDRKLRWKLCQQRGQYSCHSFGRYRLFKRSLCWERQCYRCRVAFFYSDWQCLQLRTRARISCSKLPNASHFGALASSAGVAPQLCGMAGLKKNGIAEEGLT